MSKILTVEELFDILDERWRFLVVGLEGGITLFQRRPERCEDRRWIVAAERGKDGRWINHPKDRDTYLDRSLISLREVETGKLYERPSVLPEPGTLCVVYDDARPHTFQGAHLTFFVSRDDDGQFLCVSCHWKHLLPLDRLPKANDPVPEEGWL